MACCMADDDREHAVKEVAQVYERIKTQHPLLLLLHCSSPPATTQLLAQSLLGDALRALNIALSVMKQQPPPPPPPGGGPVTITARSVGKAEPHQLSPPSPAASADSQQAAVATITGRKAKKRRSSVMMEQGKTSSWVDFTTVPYGDGYEWRKYGEKKINGTIYTRSYFRCTYKDGIGCLATKHVQQQDSSSNSDPPMFQVTYNHHHTCSSKGAAAAMNIKQEPPAVLPPTLLVEAYSALSPFHQTTLPPCQQEPSPFPIGMQQQQQPWCGTTSTSPATTTSSCISGETCDQYYSAPAPDMAAAELAPAGDDFFYDLERFLLGGDSFDIY